MDVRPWKALLLIQSGLIRSSQSDVSKGRTSAGKYKVKTATDDQHLDNSLLPVATFEQRLAKFWATVNL